MDVMRIAFTDISKEVQDQGEELDGEYWLDRELFEIEKEDKSLV